MAPSTPATTLGRALLASPGPRSLPTPLDWGGAIDNGDTAGAGSLSVTGSTFLGNSVSDDGGAINNGDGGGTGTLTVSGSTFSAGSANADGGAIDSGDNGGTGALTLTGSSLSGNSAAAHNGGAIDSGDNGGHGTLMVSGSTFSANSAADDGGAIDNADFSGTGSVSATNSTFSADHAANDGGAIDNGDDGGSATLIVSTSTFSDSTAGTDGGTIANGEGSGTGTVWAAADIFSGSCSQAAGAWNDEGYNVGSDASCLSATPASTDTDSADAGLSSLLGPLANNGGPTETILPLPSNPALALVPDATPVNLDGTTAALCPTTDQRGVSSEPGQACDAGSVQEGLPVALAQSFSTTVGTELTEPAGTLQSGVVDFNPGAGSWTAELTATATATDGTVVVFSDGTFTYAPATGFTGTDSFSYTLTDNLGYVSAPATVTLVVERGTGPDDHYPHQYGRPASGARPHDHDYAAYDRYVAAQTLPSLRPELPQWGHS